MLECVLSRWQPGIGDPTWQGWATVLIYLLAAFLALRVLGRAGFPLATRRRERLFWMFIALVVAGLAVNKQMDLQSALTAGGRCLARAQGWYSERRQVQVAFILALVGAAMAFLACLLVLLRKTWSRSILPAVGLVFICAFVLIRAVGFHHIGWMPGLPMLVMRGNTALEWTGPLLISLGAVRLLRLWER